jgi:hypothetical protein
MEEIEFLTGEARRCRRLAAGMLGTSIAPALLQMADQYDRQADEPSDETNLSDSSAESGA